MAVPSGYTAYGVKYKVPNSNDDYQIYKDSSGNKWEYNITTGEINKYANADDTLVNSTHDNSGEHTGSGTDSDFEASDFASTTNLPDWASEWIEGASDKYSGDIWSSYQKSLANLSKAPKYTELARKASESQYYSDAQRQLAAASRTGAASMAAAGTTESSIGTDYITNLAANAVKLAQTQQEVNVKAAESDYQNLVDTATATQGFSSLLSEYMSATYEQTEVDLGGLDMSSGTWNADGTGTWSYGSGLQNGKTYGSKNDKGQWEPPDGFEEVETDVNWGNSGKKYKYKGQEFSWSKSDGTVRSLSGTVSAGSGETLDSSDFAAKSGLEDFSAEAIKNVFEKYGTPGMENAVNATNRLSAAGNKGGFIDQKSQGLTNQYGALSSRTMKMLQSALGTAGLSGAAVGERYDTAGRAAIGEEALVGRNTINNATKQWNAALKTQNLTDSVTAQNSMATLIGDYLGLAKYKYDPGMDEYLNFYGGDATETA